MIAQGSQMDLQERLEEIMINVLKQQPSYRIFFVLASSATKPQPTSLFSIYHRPDNHTLENGSQSSSLASLVIVGAFVTYDSDFFLSIGWRLVFV